jgi:hypothetical protein
MLVLTLFEENLASSGDDSDTCLFPAFGSITITKSESAVLARSCYIIYKNDIGEVKTKVLPILNL